MTHACRDKEAEVLASGSGASPVRRVPHWLFLQEEEPASAAAALSMANPPPPMAPSSWSAVEGCLDTGSSKALLTSGFRWILALTPSLSEL